MHTPPSDADLRAFLDESLPPEQMAALENALREDSDLHCRLAEVRGQEDAGLHALGAIWRRHRLSCPPRSQWGEYLLGVMEPEEAAYLRFHLERIGCRYCRANLEDLQRRQRESATRTQQRRQRILQTSVGLLRGERK
jgi:hypothetical protein